MANRLKRLLRDQPLLRRAALRLGAVFRGLEAAPPGLYTLCYHQVSAAAQDTFSRQLGLLQRHGTFLDADTAAERLAASQPWTERAFLLTFDDGYADTVDVALPVIRHHAIPAMLFLVSDWIDGPPAAPGRAQGYMTRADVGTWLQAGLDIGSHSATHSRIATLDGPAVRDEMVRSAQALAHLAGRPIRHFACPWGVAGHDYDPARDPALARACGYRTFFTTRRGRAEGAADLLAMPRHVLEPEWGLYQIEALLGGRKHVRA